MINRTEVYRISIPSCDVETFLTACEAAEWYAFDTGERIMTDEGPDAEAVLLVEPLAHAHSSAVALPVSQ